MNAGSNALVFLIQIILDAYLFMLLVRLVMQKQRASFHNPVSQFIIKVTNPILKPLQKIIPGVGGYDLAIVFLLILFQALEVFLLFYIGGGAIIPLKALGLLTLGQLLTKIFNFYFFAIIIQAVVSWVPSLQASPAAAIVHMISEPIMRPVRNVIPLIGGVDISPVFVLIGLRLLSTVLINPILYAGARAALGA